MIRYLTCLTLFTIFLFQQYSLAQNKPLECDSYQAEIGNLMSSSTENSTESAEGLFASWKMCLFMNNQGQLEKLKDFTLISPFENGYAIARKHNGYVIIDTAYKVLHELNCVYATGFKNGLSGISSGYHLKGIVDVNAKVIIPARYEKADQTRTGFITKRNDTLVFLSKGLKTLKTFTDILNYEILSSNVIEIVRKDEMSGIVDAKGSEILPFQKRNCSVMDAQQLILVNSEKQYIFLDNDGKLRNTFSWVSTNHNDAYLPVKIDEQHYLYNSSNNSMRSMGNLVPTASHNNYVTVTRDKKYGLLDTALNVILPLEFDYCGSANGDLIPVKKDGTDYLYNLKSKEFQPLLYKSYKPIFGKEPLYVVKDKKYGIVNLEQEIIFPLVYDTLVSKGNRALIQINPATGDSVRLFYFDDLDILIQQDKHHFCVYNKQGKQISQFTADRIKFRNGYFSIYENNLEGILSLNGEVMLRPEYTSVRVDRYLKSFLVQKNNLYGVVWQGNKTMIPIEYDRISYQWGNYFPVKKGSLLGIYDLYGKTVLPVEFDDIYPIGGIARTLVTVKKNGLCGLYDLSSGKYILPLEYNSISYNSNYLVIEKANKKGILTLDADPFIPMEYQEFEFNEKSIVFRKDNKFGLMDMTGKIILPGSYTNIRHFRNGVGIIQTGDKSGLMNEQGKVIVKPVYEDIGLIEVNRYLIQSGNRWGMMNNSGKVLIAPVYDSHKYFEDGLIQFSTMEEHLYFDINGKLVKKKKNENSFGLPDQNTIDTDR